MGTRSLDLHARLAPTSPPGAPGWRAEADSTERELTGLFAFGPTLASACHLLGEHAALATVNAGTPRPVRVWTTFVYRHEHPDPQLAIRLTAAVTASPAGEWMATLRPPAAPALDMVTSGASPELAVEDLALLIADRYAAGQVAGSPAASTTVEVSYTRLMTTRITPVVGPRA